jgi:cyclophilin family peptidyl-prolyl cis-trans isomerase
MANNRKPDEIYRYDDEFEEDAVALPYRPPIVHHYVVGNRQENPIVFFEFQTSGGAPIGNNRVSEPKNLGRLYFELRSDIVPVSCLNFVYLVTGKLGYADDGVCYHYKGIRAHRIVKNQYFQSGDLLDERGLCSRSSFGDGRYFRDENFILRHTGPGCLSYCNRGPDTNGSLFQVTFTPNTDLDNRHVVFGCLASADSYDCLNKINSYGTDHGEPLEELMIVDCGLEFPNMEALGL